MPNIVRQITYAKKSGETWGDEIVLNSARQNEIVVGWGSQKDAASFDISKGSKFFDSDFEAITPNFEEEDLIRFYVAVNVADGYTFTGNDLLFEGTLKNANQKVSEDGNIVNVSTFNFYEVFFDVELPYNASQLTFIEHLQKLITEELANVGTYILWDPLNPTLKSDGVTALDKKDLALDYTPAFVIVEKLCSNEYTGDGQYYWYLSNGTEGKRYFSVRYKSGTPVGIIDESFPIQSISIEKGKDVVVNYVIYNVGTDLYGNSLEHYTYNPTSIGKYGWKTHYLIEETGQIFRAIWANEVNTNRSSFTFDSNDNLSSDYPSYPYVFAFASTIEVSSNSDFNEVLKVAALSSGEKFAEDYMNDRDETQYIVNINIPFRNTYVVGSLYEIKLTKTRTFEERLRLKQITYSLNGMQLSFDQDTKDRE